MKTVQVCGYWDFKHRWVHDTTYAVEACSVHASVGDIVENHDVGVRFTVASVQVKGRKAYYTPVDSTIEIIGPDAVAEELRLGGNIPRLARDR